MMRVYLDNCCYNRPFDYTEWRRDHLFVGATVDSIMDEAEAMESDMRHTRVAGQE